MRRLMPKEEDTYSLDFGEKGMNGFGISATVRSLGGLNADEPDCEGNEWLYTQRNPS